MTTKLDTHKKTRGKLLTILIFWTLLAIFYMSYTLVTGNYITQSKLIYGDVPQGYQAYILLSIISLAIRLVGIYYWQKWVIYFIAIQQLVSAILLSIVWKQLHNPA